MPPRFIREKDRRDSFITDNARIVILAGIEAVIVECETTVKVVVKYSFSIGAFW